MINVRNIQDLEKQLPLHKQWVESDGEEGERMVCSIGANLSGANLSGANLRGANLSGAYLIGANLSDAKDIFGFTLGKHFGFFQPSSGYLKIGCIGCYVDKWLERYESVGKREGYTQEEIERYGAMIKLLGRGLFPLLS